MRRDRDSSLPFPDRVKEGHVAKGANDQAIDPPSHVSERIIAKPARKSGVCDKRAEPPIHAALKKSSTLSANDGTQICIDITGDQETIEQEGVINCSRDTEVEESAVPAHFSTLAPFLEASGKWFPNFDPDLRLLLAGRAQQLAIHNIHFSSFHAALFTYCQKARGCRHTLVCMSDKLP